MRLDDDPLFSTFTVVLLSRPSGLWSLSINHFSGTNYLFRSPRLHAHTPRTCYGRTLKGYEGAAIYADITSNIILSLSSWWRSDAWRTYPFVWPSWWRCAIDPFIAPWNLQSFITTRLVADRKHGHWSIILYVFVGTCPGENWLTNKIARTRFTQSGAVTTGCLMAPVNSTRNDKKWLGIPNFVVSLNFSTTF